jgi:hypothetical protein
LTLPKSAPGERRYFPTLAATTNPVRFTYSCPVFVARIPSMRLLLITIVALGLGSGATLAQTGSSASGSAPGSAQGVLEPLRLLQGAASRTTSQAPEPNRPQPRQRTHDSAVADCMQMWDLGTHMTKQAWLRTCKRVETRLDKLNLGVVTPNAKTTSQKATSTVGN